MTQGMMPPESTIAQATYRGSALRWAFYVGLMDLLLLILLVPTAAFIVELVLSPRPFGGMTWWPIGLALAVSWMFATLLIRWTIKATRLKLVMFKDRAWIGGLFLGRTIAYETIELVGLERPETTIGRRALLMLNLSEKGRESIWLKGAHASACHDAILARCPQAASMGRNGTVRSPADPESAPQVGKAVARVLRRRAIDLIVPAVGLFLFWGCAVGRLVIGGPPGQLTSAWLATIAYGLLWIGCTARAFVILRKAAAMERGEVDPES